MSFGTTSPNIQNPRVNKSPYYGDSNSINQAALRMRTPVGQYQGGLQTDFTGYGGLQGASTYGARSNDVDVLGAQRAQNELTAAGQGNNEGVDFNANTALLNKYKSRIGIKNSLAERIAGSGKEMGMAKDLVSSSANQALDQGTRNTRRNYNQRGLLYSGMREGGEQAVRGAVAGQYASGMAGAERDSANSIDSAKAAYAAVDLENQQETLKLANSAFDTAHANSIARLQAMQQLGQGIGYAAGSFAGASSWGKGEGARTTGGGGNMGQVMAMNRYNQDDYDIPSGGGLLSQRSYA